MSNTKKPTPTSDTAKSAKSGKSPVKAAADKAKSNVEALSDRVAQKAASAQETVQDQVDQVKTAATDMIEDIDFQRMSANTTEFVRRNPATAVAAAAGVGVILGLMLAKRS